MTRNFNLPFSIVFLVSFATLAFLEVIHREQLYNTQLIMGSYDVIDRIPPWKANQSRLMGPGILKLLTILGFSKWWAIRIFTLFFVVINNFLIVKVSSSFTDSKYLNLNSLIFFNSFFIISQHKWLYVWDFIDITFFIFYSSVILYKKNFKYLLFINFLHIFNRESFLIMSIFFIIFTYFEENLKMDVILKSKVIQGLFFNIVFGVTYVYFSREILFIGGSPLIASSEDTESSFLAGSWLTLKKNFYILTQGDERAKDIIIFLFVILVLSYLIINFIKFNRTEKYFSFLMLLNISSIFLFGIYTETRLYFSSILLLTFLLQSRNKYSSKIE